MSYKGGTISVRGAEGQLYAGQLMMYHRVTEASKVIEIAVSTLSAPSGSSLYIDVRKNGTATTDSILTAVIEMTTGVTVTSSGIYRVTTPYSGSTLINASKSTLAVDDVLYIMITGIGSSFSGSDILVQIRTS